jgi:exopolysaccharide biosynthesis polyprenyl glycosylphosphotransferase
MANLYDLRRASILREVIRGILLAAGIAVILYLAIYFTNEPGSLPRRGILYFLGLVTLTTLLWRLIYIRFFTLPALMRRVLIVGAGEGGHTLVSQVKSTWPPPYLVVGLIDDDPKKQGVALEGFPILGGNSVLLDVIETQMVTDLIVAIQGPMEGEMFQAVLDAQERGVEITRMPVAYEELTGRVPIRHLETDWLLRSFVDEVRVSAFYTMIKRLIDIIGAVVGLMVLIILFPWIALAILLETGRPIFIRQTRMGVGGRNFKVIKLRTMLQDAEADGQAHWAQEDDPRKTRVGRILRKTHLDEFPQFWNVLVGEMSLVGPRPERPILVEELEREIPFYRARLLVKPGIGGWAQVNYGKGASVEGSAEKLEYDLYYIKHRNLILDLWVLLRSLGSAAGFRGV